METYAIYMRVSTRKQEFDSQKIEIERWLEQNTDLHFDDCRIYTDYARSGADHSRPALQEMIAAAKRREIDTVLVYRLDRLSRLANSAIQILLNLDELGVGFISVTQPVLNLGKKNPFRRTLLAAFSEIAELEREGTIARIQAGLKAAKERGVKLGAPSQLSPDQVSEIHSLHQQGYPMRSIATQTGISLSSVYRAIHR